MDNNNFDTKSDRKIKAIKLWNTGKYTKSDVARKTQTPRATLHAWIEEQVNNIKELDPDRKIKIWQSESLKDIRLAALARESLQETLESSPHTITPDTKRAIMYSASGSGCAKWDKFRLEAGMSINNVSLIHTLIKEIDNPRDVRDVDTTIGNK